MLKEQSKSVGKLRNVSALAKRAVKQVFPSLENVLAIAEGGVPRRSC